MKYLAVSEQFPLIQKSLQAMWIVHSSPTSKNNLNISCPKRWVCTACLDTSDVENFDIRFISYEELILDKQIHEHISKMAMRSHTCLMIRKRIIIIADINDSKRKQRNITTMMTTESFCRLPTKCAIRFPSSLIDFPQEFIPTCEHNKT